MQVNGWDILIKEQGNQITYIASKDGQEDIKGGMTANKHETHAIRVTLEQTLPREPCLLDT